MFTATVREVEPVEGERTAVYLDQTLFYPESGGQPDDRGTLGGRHVLEVAEDERGVRHIVEGTLEAGESVEGRIDWERRFDHMQQHSGQHLLSRMFVDLHGAATVGFHLGEEECTIDLDRADLTDDDLAVVERRTNDMIFQNVPIAGALYSSDEYEALRRDASGPDIVSRLAGHKESGSVEGAGTESPTGETGTEHPDHGEDSGTAVRSRLPGGVEKVRVVEITGVDRATCCGTHCRATGEIGLVKIIGTERVRQQTRIRFLCGWRAVRDYGEKHGLLRVLASEFSTGWRELGAVVPRLAADNRELSKQVEELRGRLAGSMTKTIAAPTGSVGAYDLVKRIVTLEEGVSLKDIAMSAREEEGKIVLLGAATDTGLLAFACSPDVPLDVGELMKLCVQVMGGRGGGGKDFAQGGGGDPARVPEALDEAERRVREVLD